MPVLNLCAYLLLAGDVNATTSSERMHSALARITDKFRASITPDKVECFTLALFMMRARIKREATRADVEAFVEAMELEVEQDAPALNVDGMHAD